MNDFTFFHPDLPTPGPRRGPRLRRHHDEAAPVGDAAWRDERGGRPGRGERHDRGGKPGRGERPGGPDFAPGATGPGGFAGGPGFGRGPGGFGGGPGFGPHRGGMGRGGRVKKGNVRSAVLSLLTEHSYNGYGLIGAIALHTDGAWRPSPGSIYPTLAALSAEGLIVSEGDGKRTEFTLTPAGRTYVSEHASELSAVWAEVSEEAGAGTELRQSMEKLVGAVQQVGLAGSEEQLKGATEALDAARRTIYGLLAD